MITEKKLVRVDRMLIDQARSHGLIGSKVCNTALRSSIKKMIESVDKVETKKELEGDKL
jgi:hypothetical protein